MKRIAILLIVVFAFSLAACKSQRETQEETAKQRQKDMFGNWEKDVEKWKQTRQKPTKPMWNE